MTTFDSPQEEAIKFDLINRGWLHEYLAQSTQLPKGRLRRIAIIAVIVVVTWVPLVLLSLVGGHMAGDSVKMPFIEDIETHTRYLIVTPIIMFAEIAVGLGLSIQAKHLIELGVIQGEDKARYRQAQERAMSFRESPGMELGIFVLALISSLLIRSVLGFNSGTSSWERLNNGFTLAGWWHACVSLPILYFLLFRWVYVVVCWDWFLFQVSRLNLKLTATHPDRVGGLGFLGWGIASFAPVVMGCSIFFSAAIATEILQKQESLNNLKYHCLIFLIIVLVLLYAPLLCFANRLSNCRFTGLLEFGALVWKHDRDFEEKWMSKRGEVPQESLLGNSDVQSMADFAVCYDHIKEMWLIPFDIKAFAILVLAVVLPLVPLLATTEQMREIFLKIGELLI